jgi:vanillate O-demethylase ferredoxin subunit
MNMVAAIKPAWADTLSLRVSQIRPEAVNINSYELVDPKGAELPAAAAGSHVDIHLGNGLIRQYSLCNDPADHGRYVIAVLREDPGRGGSRHLHESLRVHDRVKIGLPRNNFYLNSSATRHILVAGGIGITPLKAMMHALVRAGAEFVLHYCARDPAHAAFVDQLIALAGTNRVCLHYDGPSHGGRLNVATLLREHKAGTHLYHCGPPGLMAACAAATAHWPAGTVHSECFAPKTSTFAEPAETAGAFTVVIASNGARINVAQDCSIADALNASGIPVPTSCVSGLCGTCKLRFLRGEVDHRDYILSEEERTEYLTSCVSRARSGVLVLDL